MNYFSNLSIFLLQKFANFVFLDLSLFQAGALRRKLPTKPMKNKQNRLQMPRGMTTEVAKAANVSISTAHCVLHNTGTISHATRMRVAKIATTVKRRLEKAAEKHQAALQALTSQLATPTNEA